MATNDQIIDAQDLRAGDTIHIATDVRAIVRCIGPDPASDVGGIIVSYEVLSPTPHGVMRYGRSGILVER